MGHSFNVRIITVATIVTVLFSTLANSHTSTKHVSTEHIEEQKPSTQNDGNKDYNNARARPCPGHCPGCYCSYGFRNSFYRLHCDGYRAGDGWPHACIKHKPKLVSIGINNASFPVLQRGWLDVPVNLTRLALTNTKMQEIKPQVFDRLTKLVFLTITHSPNLTWLPPNTFIKLHQLYSLTLSNNGLRALNPGAFKGLNHTQYLQLDGNRLYHIFELQFHGMDNLYRLNLSNNNIGTLFPGTFGSTHRLHTLYLTNNILSSLPRRLLSPLAASLDRIELQHNHLSSLPDDFLSYTSHLQTLNLAHNRFLRVPTPALTRMVAYRWAYIYLDGNPMRVLTTRSFYRANAAVYVYLRNMPHLEQVEECAFREAYQVLSIHLSGCPRLSALPAAALPGGCGGPHQSSLVTLDVANNNLSVIRRELLTKYSPRLSNAYIHNNPIHCSCAARWVSEDIRNNTRGWAHQWRWEQYAPRCATPPILRGRRVGDLDPYDLTCEAPVVQRTEVLLEEHRGTLLLHASMQRGLPDATWWLPDGTTLPSTTNHTATALGVVKATRTVYRDTHMTVHFSLRVTGYRAERRRNITLRARTADRQVAVTFWAERVQPGWVAPVNISMGVMLPVLTIVILMAVIVYWKNRQTAAAAPPTCLKVDQVSQTDMPFEQLQETS